MDTETLIPYAVAVLDPRVKTEFLKAHLQEGAKAVINNLQTHFKELSPIKEKLPNHFPGAVAKAQSAANTLSFVGRSSRSLKIATSRQRMLEKIQNDYYATPATHLDEIDEWLSSPPIQEQIPENFTAEADAKWLLAWWRTNRYRYP